MSRKKNDLITTKKVDNLNLILKNEELSPSSKNNFVDIFDLESSHKKSIEANESPIDKDEGKGLKCKKSKRTKKYPKIKINSIFQIYGQERKLLLLILEKCDYSGERITDKVSTDEINNFLGCNANTSKQVIWTLCQKDIIKIVMMRKGRKSWRRFEVDDEIYQQLVKENKYRFLLKIARDRSWPVKDNQKEDGPVEGYSNDMKDEWSKIQIPHNLKNFNFGQHLIKQVRDRNYLNPQEFQDSLDAFAFDIAENDLIKTNKVNDPLRYFMGIITKKSQYAPSGNYISDESKAISENKKRFEILKKAREEEERLNLELAAEEWLMKLTEQEKKNIAPENDFFRIGSPFHTEILINHFHAALKLGRSPSLPIEEQNQRSDH